MSKLPIDTLPVELLEGVIHLGATESEDWGPELRWICEWRRVSRKWASVIDYCSALWSYIMVSPRTGQVRTQLEKSKKAPLIIYIDSLYGKEEWIPLLVNNVHRWKSIRFKSHFEEVSAMLDSPPPLLEALEIDEIRENHIPPDSKFFTPSSPNLRVLELSTLTIPSNMQPISGLEVLKLSRINEALGDDTYAPISVRKVHQFLQASPGLQVLELSGRCSVSATDKSLQQVNLPNLQELRVRRFPVLHFFRAEHCTDLTVNVWPVERKLPRGAWTTVVSTLRRAKELEVDVSDSFLNIKSLVGPPTIEPEIAFKPEGEDAGHLSYTIPEEFLQELENESCISARIRLWLYAQSEDIGVKVLKLLQSPVPGPSSRWRLPHLDTVCVYGEGFPYQYLRAFVQARANAQGDQAPNAVTSILLGRRDLEDKEILSEVMDYAGDERDFQGAVGQAG